jgi:alkylation response protein AidB-like acyl-CoA dehydrogenase
MDFELSFEQSTFVEALKGFMAKTCTKAYIDRIESTDEYPDALWDGLTELGVFGLGVPEEFGGVGGGMLEIALACEVFGYYGGSAVMTYMPTGCFGSQTLVGGASEDMKQRFLPEIANGNLKTAFGLTEPEAGSDASALRTRAVRAGDEWVINGAKIWCSGALAADYIVLSARTGAQEQRGGAITIFMVPTEAKGLQITPIPKLGHHAVPSCEVGLTDVPVPHENIIGEVDHGWRALLRTLDAERIATAAISTGSAQRCLDMALAYGLERKQFGKPIASFQAISHMLAEMDTETRAARLLTYHAAWTMDVAPPTRASHAASVAKAYATELGTRSAGRGMQVMGGYGYAKEYEMERFYREAKLYEVAGGATQIQRNIIARHLGIPAS